MNVHIFLLDLLLLCGTVKSLKFLCIDTVISCCLCKFSTCTTLDRHSTSILDSKSMLLCVAEIGPFKCTRLSTQSGLRLV